MRFSESLARYLLGRQDKSRPFFIGSWLSTLSDYKLEALRALAERWATDDESHELDDFVGVVVTAQAVERHNGTLGESELVELLQRFALVAHVESFRRSGWLELEAPLSLSLERDLSIRVTEAGMKAGDRMRVLDRSSLH